MNNESSKCEVCGMGKQEARGYRSCEKCNTKKEIAMWGTKEQEQLRKQFDWKLMNTICETMNAEKRNKSK